MTVQTVPAVLLRAHDWSETSRILRFLTPDFGIVAVAARGVRARSSGGRGPIETFARGELTVDLRADRDLHAFRDFQPGAGDPIRLGRGLLPLAGASYLAELVLAHALEEGHPALFDRFVRALEAFEDPAAGSREPEPARAEEGLAGIILSAGWGVLSDFGFPPGVERCIECGGVPFPDEPDASDRSETGAPSTIRDAEAPDRPSDLARFDVEAGGVRCARCARRHPSAGGPKIGPRAHQALVAIVSGVPPVELPGAVAHFGLLDRYALHHLAMNRPFRSAPLVRDALDGIERTRMERNDHHP